MPNREGYVAPTTPKDHRRLTMNIPNHLLERIDAQARQTGRTRSSMIVQLLTGNEALADIDALREGMEA